MNEVEFRNWLGKKNVKKKIQGDHVSRLKRVEKELIHCDIDEEYRSDRCEHLLSLFRNMGKNEEMQRYSGVNLPIGKYYMSTYKYSLQKYIDFCDEVTLEQK